MKLTEAESDALIHSHLPLAYKLAADLRRRHRGVDYDEATGEALLALCQAARDFDPGRYPDITFGVLARWRIRYHLMDWLDRGRFAALADVPRRLIRAFSRLREATARLEARGSEVTVGALAHETQLDRRTVVEALMLPRVNPCGEMPEPGLPVDGDADDLWAQMGHCTDRERDVLARRFGLDGQGERSRGKTAADLGLDVKSVRAAEESALRKLGGRLRLMA